MAEAKKATAKTAAPKKKEEPKGPEVEGFEVKDYEGLDLLVCKRCGFDTFDIGSAKAHGREHARTDADQTQRAELTENLAEHAQVTTEVADDEG
jgi:hypothetical protein